MPKLPEKKSSLSSAADDGRYEKSRPERERMADLAHELGFGVNGPFYIGDPVRHDHRTGKRRRSARNRKR